MDALELKVPPPLVGLVAALSMWLVSRWTFAFEIDVALRSVVAIVIALIGGAFTAAGITAFRRATTTLNPTKPEAASSLVTGGIYRVTRNPMYLGVLFVLVAWAVFLGAPWTFVGPLLFVVYMNRFQIGPEERALTAAFGEGYVRYKAAVRRWL
jgi:protein-S-isoprenylcysteine O-methyltransferase Ste14